MNSFSFRHPVPLRVIITAVALPRVLLSPIFGRARNGEGKSMIAESKESAVPALGAAVAFDLRWQTRWWGVSSTSAFLFGVLMLLQRRQIRLPALLNWSWLALFLLFGFWLAAFWRNWTVYGTKKAVPPTGELKRWPYARPGAPWVWISGGGDFPLWPAHAWSRGILWLTAAVLLLWTFPLPVWRLWGGGLLLIFLGWWWRTWRQSTPRFLAALLLLLLPFLAPFSGAGQTVGWREIAFAGMLLGAGMALSNGTGWQSDFWTLLAVAGPITWLSVSGFWPTALLLALLGGELLWLNHKQCGAGRRHFVWLLSLLAVTLL